ncbi:MAG: Spy/CpxP family protein refolding chaperone [Acidobacteria bacterium]|nr:Spy/CpxP family protein refolding chaperone [Acidobacteriota bacterium]
MKTLTGKLALLALALLTLSLPCFNRTALAQEDEAAQTEARPGERAQGGQDGDLVRRLNLTPEQIRQIREIRQQNAEEMRQSRQRLMQAQRSLDEAIYADTVKDSEVEARANELATAQAAVARHRALTELRIRKVLTPEQLNTLRTLREEARQRERELRRERRENPNAFQEQRRPNLRGMEKNNAKPADLAPAQRTPAGRGRRP